MPQESPAAKLAEDNAKARFDLLRAQLWSLEDWVQIIRRLSEKYTVRSTSVLSFLFKVLQGANARGRLGSE